MKHVFITLLLFCFCIPIATPYSFEWQIDETPEGQESVTTTDVNGDGEVNILDLVVVANAFGE